MVEIVAGTMREPDGGGHQAGAEVTARVLEEFIKGGKPSNQKVIELTKVLSLRSRAHLTAALEHYKRFPDGSRLPVSDLLEKCGAQSDVKKALVKIVQHLEDPHLYVAREYIASVKGTPLFPLTMDLRKLARLAVRFRDKEFAEGIQRAHRAAFGGNELGKRIEGKLRKGPFR
ncbi:hypothetical protein HK101_005567, partial [Irineochytrium annulatum]